MNAGPRWLSRAVLAVGLLGALHVLRIGWLRWPDVLVDFGRELYVPWRLTEGEVLYRDLAWFDGPLSAYWNAGVFALFGVGLHVLQAANAVLLVLLSVLLHRFLARVSSPLAASAALAFFLVGFAVGQQTAIGNYNYLAPYAHGTTHGLLLGLAAVATSERAVRTGRGGVLAGVLLGLVFLTKVEPFLAALAGVIATFVVVPRAERHGRGRTLFAAALAPPLCAAGLLALAMPFGDALVSTLGGWSGVFDGALTGLPFYREGMGLDAPLARLGAVLTGFAALLFALLPGAAVAHVARGRRAVGLLAGGFFFVYLGVLIAMDWRAPEWTWLARGLPVVLVLLLAFGSRCLARLEEEERPRFRGFLVLCVFGLVLLAKIGLNARFGAYGFVLVVPASCAVLVFAVAWLPRLLGLNAACFAAGALALHAAVGWSLVERSAAWFALKEAPVSTGRDAFVSDGRGRYVTRLLAELERRLDPDATVLVLPEGVTLDYLARRRSPTPYFTFLPPELVLFGAARMRAALDVDPPDAVVRVHRETLEYGLPYFGVDYGVELARWVDERYGVVWADTPSGPPLQPGSGFGLELLLPRVD